MKSHPDGEKVLVAYVPVPHAGYLDFFRKNSERTLYLFGEDIIQKFKPLVRHLPGIRPEESRSMILSLNILKDVRILTAELLQNARFGHILMPDEDVSRSLAGEYFQTSQVEFISIWLRWDWGATQLKRRPEGEEVISIDQLDRALISSAFRAAERSPDWWRQIGALLVKDGEIILASYNRHVPSDQSAYCFGDPRSNFEPGVSIETSCALHAEVGIIATAAKRGIRMEGCDLYVTTFPCPPCAYACAESGIGRLFYADGYALINGAEALQAKEVQILRVQM